MIDHDIIARVNALCSEYETKARPVASLCIVDMRHVVDAAKERDAAVARAEAAENALAEQEAYTGKICDKLAAKHAEHEKYVCDHRVGDCEAW